MTDTDQLLVKLEALPALLQAEAALIISIVTLLRAQPKVPDGIIHDAVIALCSAVKDRFISGVAEACIKSHDTPPAEVSLRLATLALKAEEFGRRTAKRLVLFLDQLREYDR